MTVSVHVDHDWVEAWVLDQGPQPPTGLPATPHESGAGGRGLWLLRRLVDEVRLERVRLGTRVTPRRALGPRKALSPCAAKCSDGSSEAARPVSLTRP